MSKAQDTQSPKSTTRLQSLVNNCGTYHRPAQRQIDTPEKIQIYVAQMKASTKDELAANEEARHKSIVFSRTKRLG